MVLYTPTCGQNYTFSGVLELIRTRNIQLKNYGKKTDRVLVVVHKTSSNHFAIIYPNWGLDSSRKPICTINLLSTKIENSTLNPDREFSVVSAREGVSFLFRIPEKCHQKQLYTREEWIEALANTNSETSFLKSSPTVYKSKPIQLNLSVLDEEDVNEEND